MTKVSIIIPFYNNEAYAKKCIESVMRQTYQDLEILLINDGSSDGTAAILDQAAERDSRIRIFHKENGGVSSARNLGIQEAQGEYITFIDGDDYVNETYIEDFYRKARKEQADMVLCGLTFVTVDGEVLQKLIPTRYERGVHEEWTYRISTVCSHFYRKELWDRYQIRFLEGERGEDIPIALFFSGMSERISVLSSAGYYYVQHQDSARHTFKGLQKHGLPYRGLEEAIRKIRSHGLRNDAEFHELFILRILTTFFFELGIGSSKERMKELTDYIYYILETYYPDYNRNSRAGIFSGLEIPMFQKMAVFVFRWMVKTRGLRLLAVIFRR